MAEREKSALERLRELDRPAPAQTQASAGGPGGAPGSSARKRGVIGGIVAALGLALAKGKTLIFLFLAKGKLLLAALSKFAVTAWSMVLVAVLYSRYYGAPFAIGLVVLTLVHELGHGAAAKRVGLPVSAPVFIPFFGAMIALRGKPRSTWEDFFIGAGGPVVGSAGGALCVAGAFALSGHAAGLLMAIGYFALVVNLFNLIPVWQLDGARMCEAVRPRDGAIGVALLGAVTIAAAMVAHHLNPIALFVVALAAFRFLGDWWKTRPRRQSGSALERLSALAVEAARPQGAVTASQHRSAALVYFGLAAILVIATHLLQGQLPVVAL